METKTVYDYFAFGWTFKVLCDGCPQATNKEAAALVDNFLKFLEDNKCEVAVKAVRGDVITFRAKLAPLPPGDTIGQDLSSALSGLARSMDKTISAELALHEAHILTEKRFELKHLTTNPDKLFGENVFSSFPSLAQYDFAEAGKCIAFDRATAAAYHILRGTEGVLRQYYFEVVKRKRRDPPNWGPVVDHLKERRGTPKALLDVLDNIRENFRNPTDHPEMVYNIDGVQDLFGTCVGAVNLLSEELAKRRK